jgi:hypothetical protein
MKSTEKKNIIKIIPKPSAKPNFVPSLNSFSEIITNKEKMEKYGSSILN